MTFLASRRLVQAALLAGLLAQPGFAWASDESQNAAPITQAQFQALNDRITRLADRDAVENLFSRYMYLHSAFQDRQIPALWVKKGTPGIHAQYSNNGVYNTWDSVMVYHRDRPHPTGKLVFHYSANPMIEVAADGKTAKGLWVVAGVESGLASIASTAHAPAYMYTDSIVDGKKVWAHTIQLKYGRRFHEAGWRMEDMAFPLLRSQPLALWHGLDHLCLEIAKLRLTATTSCILAMTASRCSCRNPMRRPPS